MIHLKLERVMYKFIELQNTKIHLSLIYKDPRNHEIEEKRASQGKRPT